MRAAFKVLLLAVVLAVAAAIGGNPPAPKPPAGPPSKSPGGSPPAAGGGEELGRCKNCVYVIERVKQGYHYLLPNICEEILAKTKKDDEYSTCHKLLAGLSKWGLDVRHWLHNGCYKVEPYGSMSLVQPCPSHVICSKVKDLDDKAFCDEVLTDFKAT